MPKYKFLDWGALAVAAAGSLGCMGGGTSPMASTATPGTAQTFAQQTAAPSGPTFASAAGSTAAGSAGLSQNLWNNPVSRAVKGAFGGEAESRVEIASTTRSEDPLSLSRKSQPPSAELYSSMALMAERAGNMEKAREFHDQALAAGPKDAAALLAYGHFHDRQGRMDEATRLYREAIAVDPQNAGAHNDLGLCYARQGHLSQALELVRHAAQLRPDRPIYRNNAAKVLVEMGRSEDAVSELATLLAPAEAQYNVGCFLAQAGRNDQAMHHFARAIEIDPTMQSARAWLAKLQNGAVAATQPGRASITHLPAAGSAALGGTAAANPYMLSSASAGVGNQTLPLITNVRPASGNQGDAPGTATLPLPSASPHWQQQASYTESSPEPTQQSSAWPHASGTSPGPYLDASDERYQVPSPVATTGWPQEAGNSPASAAQPSGSSRLFDGSSHNTPWGSVPSPYGETSHGPGLQYPSTSAPEAATAFSARAATNSTGPATASAAPATVVNPYATAPQQQRVVRQPWSPTIQ